MKELTNQVTTLSKLQKKSLRTSENVARKSTFNTNLGLAGCFVENTGELMVELDDKFYDAKDGTIRITPSDYLKVLGTLYTNLQDAVEECLGKPLVIEFGDSAGANAAEVLVAALLKQFLETQGE